MLPPGRPFVIELVNPHKTRFHEVRLGSLCVSCGYCYAYVLCVRFLCVCVYVCACACACACVCVLWRHHAHSSQVEFHEMQEEVNKSTSRVQIRDVQRVSKCVPPTHTNTHTPVLYVSFLSPYLLRLQSRPE